jgi:hypothetical protein
MDNERKGLNTGKADRWAGSGSRYHPNSANVWETSRLLAWALLAFLANKTWLRKEHLLLEEVAAAEVSRRVRGLPKGWVGDT